MRRRTILVADGDRLTRDALRLRLEAAGFVVRCAGEWHVVLEVVQREHPDLLVLDIGMAAGDGFRVRQCLRRALESSRIPVIHLAAETPDPGDRSAIDDGVHCVLHKPFRGIELVEECRSALESWRSADAG